jgi:hypothetical protein
MIDIQVVAGQPLMKRAPAAASTARTMATTILLVIRVRMLLI